MIRLLIDTDVGEATASAARIFIFTAGAAAVPDTLDALGRGGEASITGGGMITGGGIYGLMGGEDSSDMEFLEA